MLRLRRYLPPLVILLPLIFVCGKLLLTAVVSTHQTPFDPPFMERGWPWIYQSMEANFNPFGELPSVWDGPVSLSPLVADVALMVLATIACLMLLESHHRRHGGWFKISLRELFVFVTLVCVAVGWSMSNWVEWKRKRDALMELWDYKVQEYGEFNYYGPQWMRRFVAEEDLEHFYCKEGLGVGPGVSEKTWPAIERLIPKLWHVRSLSVEQGAIHVRDWKVLDRIDELSFYYATDGHLIGIENLPKLKALYIPLCRLSSEGLAHISGCSSLERLAITKGEIENEGLTGLKHLPRLQTLDLTDSTVDDAGMAHVASITGLRELLLGGTRVGDKGLESLQKLPNLEVLNLKFLPITDVGARRLLEFPRLKSVVLDRYRVSDETLGLLKGRIQNVHTGQADSVDSTMIEDGGIDRLANPSRMGTRLATSSWWDRSVSRGAVMHIHRVNEQVSIGGQPTEEEIEQLRREGYNTVINFRSAGEEADQLSPDDEREQVEGLKIRYFHLPTTLQTITSEHFDRFRAAYANLPKPVFAHCTSAKRAGAMVLAQLACERDMDDMQLAETAKRIGLSDKPELIQLVRNYVASHCATH
jgi:uncharacterized protein (TIGR01244 family)